MRIIKFRGLRTDGKGWVYGELNHRRLHTDSPILCGISFDNGYEGRWVEVIPATVGQFTGLKDQYGIEMYEGDIALKVKIPNMEALKIYNPPFEVRFGKGAQFYGYVDGWLGDAHLYNIESFKYGIIGKIHDHLLVDKEVRHEK